VKSCPTVFHCVGSVHSPDAFLFFQPRACLIINPSSERIVMLHLRGVSKAYPVDLATRIRSGTRRVVALDCVYLDVATGTVMGLLGPNGAGKTTLIKIVCGLVLPDAGRVVVDGFDSVRQRTEVMKRIGAVLEGNRNIYWRLTVIENLRYFGLLKGCSGRRLASRVDHLVDFFGLGDKRHHIAANLSRGMQQRLAVAVALVADPPVLLLDEPTLGLDVESSRDVRALIRRVSREERKTLLLSTHQMALAEELCGRVAIISRGRILHCDETSTIFRGGAPQTYRIRFRVPERNSAALEVALRRVSPDASVERDTLDARVTVEARPPALIYRVLEALGAAGCALTDVTPVDGDIEERYVRLVRGGASL